MVWTAVAIGKVPSFLLPPPEDVLPRIATDRQSFINHSWITIQEILFGFGWSVVTAIPVGLLIAAELVVPDLAAAVIHKKRRPSRSAVLCSRRPKELSWSKRCVDSFGTSGPNESSNDYYRGSFL